MGALRCEARPSAHAADLELEALDLVAGLLRERQRETEFERADRRVPRETDARRITEALLVALDLERLALLGSLQPIVPVDLTGIGEHAGANGLVALQDRVEQLDVRDHLA